MFLTTDQIDFSPTGVGNRVAMAAAVGVATSFVGVIGALISIVPSPKFRCVSFCLAVTLLCTSGFLVTNTIAKFWLAASRVQESIVASVRRSFPTLPAKTAIILDGVCPYIGPGIVFEASWDVSGMLQLQYNDPTLKGDIIKDQLEITNQGLYMTTYGVREYYPYSDKLWLYNHRKQKGYRLVSSEAARLYFHDFVKDGQAKEQGLYNNPDYRRYCPEGAEGWGVKIF